MAEVTHLAAQFALTDDEAKLRDWKGARVPEDFTEQRTLSLTSQVWYHKGENDYVAGSLESYDWDAKKGVFISDEKSEVQYFCTVRIHEMRPHHLADSCQRARTLLTQPSHARRN